MQPTFLVETEDERLSEGGREPGNAGADPEPLRVRIEAEAEDVRARGGAGAAPASLPLKDPFTEPFFCTLPFRPKT